MTSGPGSKINKLLRKWPSGTVAVSRWLEKQGAYQQLVHEYEKSAWIKRIGQGAFIRYGDSVDWTGGLFAIQKQMALPIHVGGKTALQIQGYAHFVPLGKGATVSLWGEPQVKLPAWFKKYPWEVKIQYRMSNLFPKKGNLGLTQKEVEGSSLVVSTPERGILEVLDFVPQQESFEEASLLMEGLTTLRPQLVQKLLEVCDSVKVKRLFLYLAEGCNLSWIKRVDLTRVNLGTGSRMIIKESHFDSKYKISVPRISFKGLKV